MTEILLICIYPFYTHVNILLLHVKTMAAALPPASIDAPRITTSASSSSGSSSSSSSIVELGNTMHLRRPNDLLRGDPRSDAPMPSTFRVSPARGAMNAYIPHECDFRDDAYRDLQKYGGGGGGGRKCGPPLPRRRRPPRHTNAALDVCFIVFPHARRDFQGCTFADQSSGEKLASLKGAIVGGDGS